MFMSSIYEMLKLLLEIRTSLAIQFQDTQYITQTNNSFHFKCHHNILKEKHN